MQGELENLEGLIISSKLDSRYKMQPYRKTTVQKLKLYQGLEKKKKKSKKKGKKLLIN